MSTAHDKAAYCAYVKGRNRNGILAAHTLLEFEFKVKHPTHTCYMHKIIIKVFKKFLRVHSVTIGTGSACMQITSYSTSTLYQKTICIKVVFKPKKMGAAKVLFLL